MAAVVDDEECISCGNCVESCPVDAITLEEVAMVNGSCVECNSCISTCPADAISMN